MNDEEAQVLLRGLRGALGALGPRQVDAPARALPEDQDLDVRQALALVLEEYESLLVHGPDLIERTMGLLKANSMSFRAEHPEFEDKTDGPNEVRFTAATVKAWRETTAPAREMIDELRRRLNGQPS
ncbi:hypothetical protein [Brevundimonas diminuta]|uniref:hypothetical protein n=1 Tax=Brevundimonas diminuta TaxID=293 RepID=UPI0025A63F10|nr:hypothetical protein [Brevundimonas diminuta]MDM8354006.1 hypothetical protein [Brevundimonas diminuta]